MVMEKAPALEQILKSVLSIIVPAVELVYPPHGELVVQVSTRKVISRWQVPTIVPLLYSSILYTTSDL